MKTLSILVIGGWTNSIGDGSPIWAIAEALALRGHRVDRRGCGSVCPDDLKDRNIVVAYSYGCAALWHAKRFWESVETLPDEVPGMDHLFIIAGVPRAAWGQTYLGHLWTVPDNYLKATCFQVHSFPASLPISNPSARCKNILVGGASHTSVFDYPIVLETILNGVRELEG